MLAEKPVRQRGREPRCPPIKPCNCRNELNWFVSPYRANCLAADLIGTRVHPCRPGIRLRTQEAGAERGHAETFTDIFRAQRRRETDEAELGGLERGHVARCNEPEQATNVDD